MEQKNHIQDILNWMQQQNQQNDPLSEKKRYARNFGIISAPLSTAIVYPFAKQFGRDFLTNILRTNNRVLHRVVPTFFAVSGLLSVSAVAAYICADVFEKMVDRKENTFNIAIDKNHQQNKLLTNSKLALAVALGQVSVMHHGYLTLQHFTPRIGFPAAFLLGGIGQVLLGAVSSWSLYHLPSKLSDTLTSTFVAKPNLSERKRIMMDLASRLNSSHDQIVSHGNLLNAFSSQSKNINRNENISSSIGITLGIISSYFFYPLGKAAGLRLQDALKIPSRARLPIALGTMSFICNGLLAAYGTSQCAKALVQSTDAQNEFQLRDLILLSIAISSSAHRITMTKQFVNPSTLFGKTVLACATTSIVSTNFWFAHSFVKSQYDQDLKNTDSRHINNNLRLCLTQMDDEHLQSLHHFVMQNDRQDVEPTPLTFRQT